MRCKSNLRKPNRRGMTIIELLVAGALLLVGLSFVAQGAVSIKRLGQDTRHYQLALDELRNKLDYLVVLPAAELPTALEELQVSDGVGSALRGAKLTGKLIQDDAGDRLLLELNWNRPVSSHPITLVGWLRNQNTVKPGTIAPEPQP